MEKYVIYFLAFLFIAFLCLAGILFPLLIEELSKANERKKFRSALTKAVASGPISWKQVRVLADRYHLSQRYLSLCLTRLIADALEGNGGLTAQQVGLFEGHYDQVQKDEPFDGIPNDVRFHLERVREKLGKSDDLLRPLAKQLQDLSSKTMTKERNMKFISLLSLLVGFVGAIFGALPLLDQSKASSPVVASISEHSVPKANTEQSSEPVKQK